jgi:1-acyl-sn-glycerol-3-phosphate acyltransferase
MLYRLFKFLFYLTTKAYFRSIYIENRKVVPEKGPVVFVANHTSAFMDPILLATHIKRELYFLARGDAFKSGFSRWLFPKLHMIPVYRPDLFPNDTHKNKQVFEKCFEHLENQRTVMIFPEGISKTERRLRSIKTGGSRIALTVEERNNFKLGTVIIPIGINYTNPHHFKSDVFVKFGDPIKVSTFKESYFENKKGTVLKLTELIKSKLEDLTISIEEEKHEKIIKKIEILFRSSILEKTAEGHIAPKDFDLSKDIVSTVEYYSKNKPQLLEEFKVKITSYLTNLKRLKIRDTQIRNENTSLKTPAQFLYFIFGFPIFLYGYIFNFIPFKSVELLAKKIPVRADFVGSMKLGLGLFLFLICYSIECIVFIYYTPTLWALVFVLSLYPTGLFTVSYIKEYFKARGTLKYIFLKRRKSTLINQLKTTRQEIVTELEEGKNLYLSQLEK